MKLKRRQKCRQIMRDKVLAIRSIRVPAFRVSDD